MKRTALILTPLAGIVLGAGLTLSSDDAVSAEMTAHPGVHYQADPVHSNVMFMIKHGGISNFYGRFNSFEGTFYVDPNNPDESHFEATIELDSVDTGNGGRDGHLKGPDFFNVRQFPTATFESTGFRRTGDENVFELTGEFSLHGVTRPITAEVEYFGTGTFQNKQIASFEAVFTVNRSDFGITQYLSSGTLGDEVTIVVAVEGVKQGG